MVVALVSVTDGPLEHAVALHFVSLPRTFKDVAVCPLVSALAMDFVCDEIADVFAQLRPSDVTFARLLAVLVGALIVYSVRPGLLSFALLPVVVPLAAVMGTICVRIVSEAMRFSSLPVPDIDIAIRVQKSASSIRLVVGPISFILTTIDPLGLALSVPLIGLDVPLTDVEALIVRHSLLGATLQLDRLVLND